RLVEVLLGQRVERDAQVFGPLVRGHDNRDGGAGHDGQGTLRPLPQAPDIALVSLGTTPGLRRSDEAFAQLVRSAGASCEIVPVRIGAAGRLRRQIAVTDLVEAVAARRSARGIDARALVFSTVTAS